MTTDQETRMSTDLTPAQERVLRATADLLSEQGTADYREVAARVGLASHSTARWHLKRFEGLGLVQLASTRQARGVRRLTDRGRTAVRALRATS